MLQAGLIGGAGVAVLPLVALARALVPGRPAQRLTAGVREFNTGWLFGGPYVDGAADPGYDDTLFVPITLPHTVTPLSWRDWDPATWQRAWIYRRHFDATALRQGRLFVDFDGVMTNAAVLLNGVHAGFHRGGYLPWSVELTGLVAPGDNVLAVIVDSRWLDVPPDGAPAGAGTVDFLQPGGIYRDARLRIVPGVFISDVFARPVNVLAPGRGIEVRAAIDAAAIPESPVRVVAQLLDGSRRIAAASTVRRLTATGATVAELSLESIGDVTLWSPDTPKLYTVQVTLWVPGGGSHSASVRVGFREAAFRLDGFYLNGKRFEVFGLNRHQLFPYAGMAMGSRVQRRDAEILRNDLNCTMVRCAHYPQSPHFLDACDELGLMVWEEAPGWHYVGGPRWQAQAEQDIRDMVIRDRSRPSVVVWGTRLNETRDSPELYSRARRIADELDGSRQTSGAMDIYSPAQWAEDVFAFNDYHVTPDGHATLLPPLPGVPYLVTEAVGAHQAPQQHFRWTDPPDALARQAVLHAQVHAVARSDARYAGLLGWAAFDYASLLGGADAVKWAGVADGFRVPKPGAAFYQAQVDPRVRPVIMPTFFWDFGPGSPPHGPGPGTMIATNCERLEIYAGGRRIATGAPAPGAERFGHLAYPPVFADLTVDGRTRPELRVEGYVDGARVAVLRMSADPSGDRLVMAADDTAIEADGSDATRVTFRALDAYGNQRRHVTGDVRLSLAGPAVLVGDNPFAFGEYGGLGAAWIRSLPGETGLVTLTARHATLGRSTVRVNVTPPAAGRRIL